MSGEELVKAAEQLKEIVKVAELLIDNDAVQDAFYDLRGTILQELKEEGYVSQETSGSDFQPSIDRLILMLMALGI